ncbi:hypothetical protein HY439_01910 [Candidatus Microgenomates bacterium]|nr:hypothetical protein [Candidatus Microgenomates bacterium]
METKEKLPFAYTVSELARSLVIVPSDAPEEIQRKCDGCFFILAANFSLNIEQDLQNRQIIGGDRYKGHTKKGKATARFTKEQVRPLVKRGILNSKPPYEFENLLVLVATEHPIITDLGLTESEIRTTLYRGAEKVVSETKSQLAANELGLQVEFYQPSENIDNALLRKTIFTLQAFQEKLLMRVLLPSPDINNK